MLMMMNHVCVLNHNLCMMYKRIPFSNSSLLFVTLQKIMQIVYANRAQTGSIRGSLLSGTKYLLCFYFNFIDHKLIIWSITIKIKSRIHLDKWSIDWSQSYNNFFLWSVEWSINLSNLDDLSIISSSFWKWNFFFKKC